MRNLARIGLVPSAFGATAVVLIAFAFQLEFGTASASPAAVTVGPSQGVSFSQVNFTWPGATTPNSNTGQVDVDISTLTSSAGISSGYLNVFTGYGWAVQNLPVSSSFPYPTISTKFQLIGMSGSDITSLLALVDFSASPVTSFSGTPATLFTVGNTEFNGEGKGSLVSGGPPAPPPPGAVYFILGGLMQACLQPGHPNVEAAHGQCGPAAVSNSLQWLENRYAINVPHPNNHGLGCAPPGGDGSLVSELDFRMPRACTGRQTGSGVNDGPFLNGKLCYLSLFPNLANGLTVEHQDDGALIGDPGAGNFGRCGLTSFGQGAAPTAAFITERICRGADVELGYSDPGGHWVEVVGAGSILVY